MGQLARIEAGLAFFALLEQCLARRFEARVQSQKELSCRRGQNAWLGICVGPAIRIASV